MRRRSFLALGLCAIAAPAIVRASSLMPVKAWVDATAFSLAPGSLNYGPPIMTLEKLLRARQIMRDSWRGDAAYVLAMPPAFTEMFAAP